VTQTGRSSTPTLITKLLANPLAQSRSTADAGGHARRVRGGVILNQSAHDAAPTQLLDLDQRHIRPRFRID
jgi:hypothetical protein